MEEHLTYGAMLGLVTFQRKKEKSNENRHLAACPSCHEHFELVQKLVSQNGDNVFQNINDLDSRNACLDPTPDIEKMVSVLILLQKNQLSQEQALGLVAHLNSCYHCFESISRNWSDYLQMSEPN